MIENHRLRKAEIDARADNFGKAKELGQALVKQQHYARNQVGTRLKLLESQLSALHQDWEDHESELRLCKNWREMEEGWQKERACLRNRFKILTSVTVWSIV